MALTFNGTSPTQIVYNGTNLTVLKYGTTSVWGKPFSVIIWASASNYATVTITRLSSPNQHASTGTVATGTNVIYHGDNLRITVTPNSGYTLSSFTINGTKYTSSPRTITVTGAVSIADAVVAVAPAAWYTIFTGSSTAQNMTTTASTVVLSPTITIPSNATRIRITGSYRSKSTSSTTFTDRIISLSSSTTTYSFTSYVRLQIVKGTTLKAYLVGTNFLQASVITITKLEAYY